jgi:hypothetical protein
MVELRRVQGVCRPLLLGEIHRDIGALQQDVDVPAMRRVAGDPDARLDVQREAVDEKRFVERGEDT